MTHQGTKMQPQQFYEVLPDGRYRFRVDHHLINDHNTCDTYFKFRHMPDAQGLVYGSKTLSIKIALGQWWSATMEALYHELSYGTLPSEHLVYKFAGDAWTSVGMEQYKQSDPDYFDKFGGLDGARLMALEYYNAFVAQHLKQWQIIGPELGFGWKDEVFLGEDDRVVVYYGGKPDLTLRDLTQNMVMPLDFKTTDGIRGDVNVKYKPHPQTAGYIFALNTLIDKLRETGEVSLTTLPPRGTKCIVMVCSRLRPSDKPRDGIRKPRFAPVYVNYTADEIEEWRVGVLEKCRRLRDSIERNQWPRRESACHTYYGGCAFRRVCSTPSNARALSLQADFIKIAPWTPYEVED